MAPGRAKRNGALARLSSELDPIGVTTEKADEFVQLFLHALGNKDIAIKLMAAMGVSQQLAAGGTFVAFGASQQGRPYRDPVEEGRRHRAPAGRAGAVLAPKLGAPLRVDRRSRRRRDEGVLVTLNNVM